MYGCYLFQVPKGQGRYSPGYKHEVPLQSLIILDNSDFGTDRKRICASLLVLSSNLDPILPRFRDNRAIVRRKPLFPYPSLFRSTFLGVPFAVDRGVGVCREQTKEFQAM